jgi:hypothetical protein
MLFVQLLNISSASFSGSNYYPTISLYDALFIWYFLGTIILYIMLDLRFLLWVIAWQTPLHSIYP